MRQLWVVWAWVSGASWWAAPPALLPALLLALASHSIPALRYNIHMIKLCTRLRMVTKILALPCVVTYLYLIAGYSSNVAYAHIISGLVPAIMYLLKCDIVPLTDGILAANILSLLYFSYIFDNTWGIGLSVCHFLNHFILKIVQEYVNAPPNCLFAVGMCFFNMFALKTVKNV